jgi:2'-5' RNA ligase
MPRMFIAIDLPPAIVGEVRAICTDLPAARWSNFAQLHLTLRFLGEVPDDRVATVRAELAGIEQAAFTLGVRGVGVFPKRRWPVRVLWAGVTPEEPAIALKQAIDVALGPDPEAADRGYSPHLTLARFREDPRPALAEFLEKRSAFAGTPWTVPAFHLYRSTLGSTGATHEIIQSYPLR